MNRNVLGAGFYFWTMASNVEMKYSWLRMESLFKDCKECV
jgi:hypothetical protein